MTINELRILHLPKNERGLVEPILEESFQGLYLWHSRRFLKEAEDVWTAMLDGEPIGVLIPKLLREGLGYIYYVAVRERYRGRGIGGRLLDHALEDFSRKGAESILASIEEDNAQSHALFESRGFTPTDFDSISAEWGRLEAARLYSKMMVVPGERLLRRRMDHQPHPRERP